MRQHAARVGPVPGPLTVPPEARASASAGARLARHVLTGVLLATLAALALWTRGFTALPHTYTMTGESMAPTVGRGDWFLARPYEGLPDPGALVVIVHWIDDTLYHVLRRAVGLPGDTLAMREGRLTVNERAAPWPHRVIVPAADRTLDGPIAGTIYGWGPVAIGPDSVFVLSDTRDMIGWPDSRFFGPIPRERVVGEYVLRLWRGASPSRE